MSDNDEPLTPGAGNGLLSRRALLQAGAGSSLLIASATAAASVPASARPAWMKNPGAAMSGYGQPSSFEAGLVRQAISSQPGTTGAGVSRSPLAELEGTITPNGLFFERHHSGIPDIDPNQHELVIHGLVRQPLRFSMDTLHRYPMVSRQYFLECSGNSGALMAQAPGQNTCAEIHGLISASEWTGIRLATLLEEAGVDPQATWIIAEGADAAMMSRSVPMSKALDDAMLVLYQNGEKLRPENGYPLRLLLPGWEGNMSVKWLRRLQITEQPAMTRDETSKYTDLASDGRASLFTFLMGVKSVITTPSGGQQINGQGIYQINGLAWSGSGRIRRVEVSADGGSSWADALLDEPVQDRHLTRFRSALHWQGQPVTLLSRATDDAGAIQPTRAAVLAGRASGAFYHVNAIQAWQIASNGGVSNVYV